MPSEFSVHHSSNIKGHNKYIVITTHLADDGTEAVRS